MSNCQKTHTNKLIVYFYIVNTLKQKRTTMYKHCLLFVLIFGFLHSVSLAESIQEDEHSGMIEQNDSTEETLSNHSNFFIKLSVDNHIKSSQQFGTDVAFSAISSLGYINNYFDLSNNIFARLGFGYAAFLVTLLNHEIVGHGLKAIEFDGRIKKVTIRPFSGETEVSDPKPYHMQKEALISLAGMEVDYLLSQKLFDNLVYHNQQIDPVTAFGYIFSAGDQAMYVYSGNSREEDGHDVKDYAKYMNIMYGKDSMSLSKIKKVAWLDALDPVLWFSLYSAVTGNHVDIPMIKVFDSVGFMPFARSILTPYGAIEKKVGTYIFTEYTPIKIGFRFGKQSKSTNKVKESDLRYYKKFNVDKIGVFNGLKPGEKMKEHVTYGLDLSIFKLVAIDRFVLGVDASIWKQPKLFTSKPYFEETKFGGMVVFNGSYQVGESFSILAKLGYKTKGFVPGHHLDKTPIVSLGFEQKL